jgi:Tol biopolymer transport system component
VRLQIDRSSMDPYDSSTEAFAVSPDGRFLAYYTVTNGRATLTVQTLATGERRQAPGSTVLVPQAAFWSDDSLHIVYTTALTRAASPIDVTVNWTSLLEKR